MIRLHRQRVKENSLVVMKLLLIHFMDVCTNNWVVLVHSLRFVDDKLLLASPLSG